METLFTSLRETWKNLSLRTRIAGGVIVLIVFLSLLLIALSSGTDYQPLYTNLDLSDAAAITRALSENNIPYRLQTMAVRSWFRLTMSIKPGLPLQHKGCQPVE